MKASGLFLSKNQKGGHAKGIPYHDGNDSRERGESFEKVYSQRDTYRQDLDHPDRDSVLTLDPVADALISTAVTVAALSDTGPVRNATSMRQHVDSKAMRETRRKKIAMGHKPDDHEDEEPAWSQTMM